MLCICFELCSVCTYLKHTKTLIIDINNQNHYISLINENNKLPYTTGTYG